MNTSTPSQDEIDFALQSMQAFSKDIQKSENPYTPTEEEMDFANSSMNSPIAQELPWYKSFSNAAGEGLTRGFKMLGEGIGSQFLNEDPFGESGNQFGQVLGVDLMPEEFKKMKKENQFGRKLDSEREEQFEKDLATKFPHNEGFTEDVIQKAGKLAPLTAIGPGSLLSKGARTLAASTVGATAKELGAGETGQNIAEMVTLSAPNPTKIIQAANGRQQKLLDFGRRMGMTEEEMAPLMNGDNWFTRALMKFSKKTGRAQNALKETGNALGDVLDTVSLSPEAQQTLTGQSRQTFLNNFRNNFTNLPANLRNEILQDMVDLSQGPLTGERLINFYRDVGDTSRRIGGHRGRRLGGISENIREAISDISPELAEDFNMSNELYRNYHRIRTRLEPSRHEDLINSAKAIGALGFLFTGKWMNLKSLLGYNAAKRLATEMLVNPRLVNIQHKTIRALNENKVPLVNKLLHEFSDEISEEMPDFSQELKKEKFNPEK